LQAIIGKEDTNVAVNFVVFRYEWEGKIQEDGELILVR